MSRKVILFFLIPAAAVILVWLFFLQPRLESDRLEEAAALLKGEKYRQAA